MDPYDVAAIGVPSESIVSGSRFTLPSSNGEYCICNRALYLSNTTYIALHTSTTTISGNPEGIVRYEPS